jgi:glycerol 2-dehydrogenase (NADP+)
LALYACGAHASSGKTLQPEESSAIVNIWLAMEKLLDTGTPCSLPPPLTFVLTPRAEEVKPLGVSNSGVPLLKQLAADPHVKVVPATNQVELHPYLPLEALRTFLKKNNLVLTAYSPISAMLFVLFVFAVAHMCAGQPSPGKSSLLLDDVDVVWIAKAHGAAPAQALLSLGVQHSVVVIPKSENEGRMRANLAVRPSPFLPRPGLTTAQVLKLGDDEMCALDVLRAKKGRHRSLLDYHGGTPDGPGVVLWSYA